MSVGAALAVGARENTILSSATSDSPPEPHHRCTATVSLRRTAEANNYGARSNKADVYLNYIRHNDCVNTISLSCNLYRHKAAVIQHILSVRLI